MLCPHVEQIKLGVTKKDMKNLKALSKNGKDELAFQNLTEGAKNLIRNDPAVHYFLYYDRSEGKSRFIKAKQDAAKSILKIMCREKMKIMHKDNGGEKKIFVYVFYIYNKEYRFLADLHLTHTKVFSEKTLELIVKEARKIVEKNNELSRISPSDAFSIVLRRKRFGFSKKNIFKKGIVLQ